MRESPDSDMSQVTPERQHSADKNITPPTESSKDEQFFTFPSVN